MEYSKYNHDLQEFARQVAAALQGNFIGFYVTGSFVMDSWNESTSDIDFIVITKEPVSVKEISELEPLHIESHNHAVLSKLEGEYIDITSLQKLEYDNLKVVNVANGALLPDTDCKLSADNVRCLIEYGKVLAGEAVEDLDLKVSEEQYKNALYNMLLEEKVDIAAAEDFSILYDSLINCLRCVYGLRENKLPTKPQAIEYCKNLLDDELYHNILGYQRGLITHFELDKQEINAIADYGLSLYHGNQAPKL